VLRVAINQIYRASGGDSNYAANFVPNYIVLNPDDVAAMELTKNTQGNYLLPPFLSENGNMIGGCQIIANSGITSGKFLVGDFTKMMVAMREDATISVGLENADFTLNLVTILCELRAVTWIPSNYLNAFVYGTFSTAISYLKDAKS
jgi:HK97 family phage major capsid protein